MSTDSLLTTPPRTPKISGLKSQVLKNEEKLSRFFYFEILLASDESEPSWLEP